VREENEPTFEEWILTHFNTKGESSKSNPMTSTKKGNTNGKAKDPVKAMIDKKLEEKKAALAALKGVKNGNGSGSGIGNGFGIKK
jgi:hypothetical protein